MTRFMEEAIAPQVMPPVRAPTTAPIPIQVLTNEAAPPPAALQHPAWQPRVVLWDIFRGNAVNVAPVNLLPRVVLRNVLADTLEVPRGDLSTTRVLRRSSRIAAKNRSERRELIEAPQHTLDTHEEEPSQDDNNGRPDALQQHDRQVMVKEEVMEDEVELEHPAPFLPSPYYCYDSKLKAIPPKPSLQVSKTPSGIRLNWDMCIFSSRAQIYSYELFSYQEKAGPVTSSLWKKFADVNAKRRPLSVTCYNIMEGHRYHFTIRAVDEYYRIGPFSDAVSILYTRQPNPNELF